MGNKPDGLPNMLRVVRRQIFDAAKVLTLHQNKDGGWGGRLGIQSSTVLSSLPQPVEVLARAYRIDQDIRFMDSMRKVEQLLFDSIKKIVVTLNIASQITTHLTLYEALNRAEHLTQALNMSSRLVGIQKQDGSWGTKLALGGQESTSVACISALIHVFTLSRQEDFLISAEKGWKWLINRNSKFTNVYTTSFLLYIANNDYKYFDKVKDLFSEHSWRTAFDHDRWLYSKYSVRFYPESAEAIKILFDNVTSHIRYFRELKIDDFHKPKTSEFTSRLLYLIGFYEANSRAP